MKNEKLKMKNMKTNIKGKHLISLSFIICSLSFSVALTSCSPEEFDGADASGLPTMDGVDFQLSVDQETNQMVASYTAPAGTYPVWILDGTSYSTLTEVGYKNDEAGTHTVELKLGNRNGISQGSVKKTYTFNETKIDYSADFRRITGKEWRIANKEAGHMGCGEAGTDGSGWWSAGADDKKAFGVYDDRITFTADTRKGGNYTYNPGADGKTYVNKETKWANGAAEDVDVELGEQTASWSFEELDWTDKEGNVSKQRYIRLSANTLFPYISSDAQYEDPLFRVEQLTAKKIVLVYDKPDRSIAWRFILTSEEGEKEWAGFDANSEFNMWKGITPAMSFYYNPDPGWGNEQTPLFEDLFKMGDNDYNITVPQQCFAEWQAQVHFHTNLQASAATNYDFSCIFNSDRDIDGVVVKLTNEDDSEAIIDAHDVNLKAGEEYIFWVSDVPGKDLSRVKLVLDFGHATGETNINVSSIVLKDHANNDGTVPPNNNDQPNPDQPVMDWDYESNSNLWKAVDDGTLFDAFGYWFADNGWTQIANSEATHNGDTYEITLPEGMGGSQWQGQFHIDTKLTASAAKTYNFFLVMEADQDCPQVTFKLTDAGDTNYFIEERNDVKADEPFILKREGVTLKEGKDAEAIRLFFDFGGSPAGTHVKISKIYFEEAISLNYDDADNLWKAVDDGTLFDAFGYWFADNSWTQIANSECVHNGDVYEITLPEGMGGSQWQGQFHIDTKLTASASKAYNFQLVMETDADCPGVTIKLTDAGDTNFFCEGRHDITADEPYVYTLKGATLKEGADATAIRLFFDFGGSPAGTHVKISKIIFKEA
jgi:hypothetical protein